MEESQRGGASRMWARAEPPPRGASLGARIAYGVSWSALGNLVSSGATLLASVLLARMLGALQFGEFSLVQNTLGFFVLLVGPTLGLAATKYAAELKYSDTRKLGRILRLATVVTYLLSSVLAVGVAASARFLAATLLKAPELEVGLRVAAIALLAMAINGVQVGVLTGFEAFRAVAIVSTIRGIVTVPALWLGAAYYGVLGAIWGMATTWAIACAISAYLVRHIARDHDISFWEPGFWVERGLLFNFSVPGWMAGILAAAANWMGSVILARQHNGLEQTGIFGAANQLFLLLLFVPQIIGNSSLPIVSERIGAGDRVGASSVVKRSFLLNFLSTGPPAFILALASPFIMSRFGHSYASDWPVLVVTLATVPCYALALAGANGIVATGRMWAFTALHVLYLFVFVGMARYTSGSGALGLAYARAAAYLVFCLGVLLQIRSLLFSARSGR